MQRSTAHSPIRTTSWRRQAGLLCLSLFLVVLVLPQMAWGQAPTSPTGFTVEAGDVQVVLSWDDPSDASLTWEYRRQCLSCPSVPITGWLSIPGGDITTSDNRKSYTVTTGLINAEAYTFLLRARNADGPSSLVVSTPSTPFSMPAPRNLTGRPGNGQVALSWAAPPGVAVTDWEYRYFTDSRGWSAWQNTDSTATTLVVKGLTNGLLYTFVLRGVTASGSGLSARHQAAPSSMSAPENLKATAGDTQVTLTWAAPSGVTVTGWKYRYFLLGEAWGAWTSTGSPAATVTVTGLTNGQSYGFAVKGVIADGDGASSEVRASPVSALAPAKPVHFLGTGGDGQVTLSWDDPDDASLTWWYRYYPAPGTWVWAEIPSGDITTSKSRKSFTVAGLTNGEPYIFQIKAANTHGSGTPSEYVRHTPVAAKAPARPVGLLATPGDGQVTLSWDDPDDTSITTWQYRHTPNKIGRPYWETWTDMADNAITTAESRKSFTVVTGLTNEREYVLHIRAVNAHGSGVQSTNVRSIPVAANTPAKPVNFGATAGDAQVILSWDNPGDASITGWQYRKAVTGSGWGAWTDIANSSHATTYTVPGLTNAVEYTFQVRAANSTGKGVASDTAVATPVAANAPAKPANLAATAGDGEVTLSWDDPSDVSITKWQYRLGLEQQHTISKGDWQDMHPSGASTTSYTVSSLVNGRRYHFWVRAVNGDGAGKADGDHAIPQVDTTAPEVSFSPADGATVEPDVAVVVRFSERVRPTAGGTLDNTNAHAVMELKKADGNGGDLAGLGQVTIDGAKMVITIDPANDLAAGSYTVRLLANAVEDLSGNAVAATSATFRVDDRPETIHEFKASAKRITKGEKVTLTWMLGRETGDVKLEDSHGNALIAGNAGDGDGPVLTSFMHGPTKTTTYTLTGYSRVDGSETVLQVSVSVSGEDVPPNAVPVAMDDERVAEVVWGGRVEIPAARLLANDEDADGDTLTITAVSAAQAGTVRLSQDGATITFVHDATADEKAEPDFTYTVSDGKGGTDEARVTLTVLSKHAAVARQRFAQLNREMLSLQALSLSDQTSRAIDRRLATLTAGTPESLSYELGGHRSVGQTLRSAMEQGQTGTVNFKQMLGNSAFVLPLRLSDSGTGLERLTLWGSGQYTNLASDRDRGLEWDGDLFSAQVGAEVPLRPDLLAGVSVTWADGGFDYQDRRAGTLAHGTSDNWLVSVQPYVGWVSPEGLGLWATVGYGWGELELDDAAEQIGRQASTLTLTTAAVGARGPLLARAGVLGRGTTTLTLKSDAAVVQVEVEDADTILAAQTVEAGRVRVGLEGRHEHVTPTGERVVPFIDLGFRYDLGDGLTGVGGEVGGGVRYQVPRVGLTIEGRGRGLVGHRGYTEWGASGLVRVDPGARGHGLAVSLVPAYGQTASGVQRLWAQGIPGPQGAPSGMGPTNGPRASRGRLTAEVGYGLAIQGGAGVFTPYGVATVSGLGGQQYRLGGRWALASGIRLSLEGARQAAAAQPADQGVRLQAEWRW